MKSTQRINGVDLRSYDSLSDFVKFVKEGKTQSRFAGKCSSKDIGSSWTGTENYEEAEDLLEHGSQDLSKKLESSYGIKIKDFGTAKSQKSYYDVCGYQASVPRYLQGIPTSMVNTKKVVQKQKVVTFNKDMNYSSSWSTERMIDECAKSLAIVKMVETAGYRVNINLVWVVRGDNEHNVGCKIRIKNASERMNISKLAFVMAHPSMLRRILFRWMEVNEDANYVCFTRIYGHPYSINYVTEKDEINLPIEIKNVEDFVKSLKI